MKKKNIGTIFLVNGPNLNLLGYREPEKYGTDTLADISRRVERNAKAQGFSIKSIQSNASHDLINFIHKIGFCHSLKSKDGILLNAGGLTHFDVGLRDAVAFAQSKGVPTVEVHLSKIDERETFRHISLLTEVCVAKVTGLKAKSYTVGLGKLISHLEKMRSRKSKSK